MNAPLPAPTTHLLDLFQGPLRDVRFPDADGERLGAAVTAVGDASEALARAEAAVETARGVLADRLHVVAQETERTLAYARIYAADRPELRAALEAVQTPSPVRRGPGRPRKISVGLPANTAAELREPREPREPSVVASVTDDADASAAHAAAE